MAANTQPIFTRKPSIQWANNIVTANTGLDITSGTSYLVFDSAEGGNANGSFVKEIRIKPGPGQAGAATAVRVWLNNGASLGTETNTVLIAEYGMSASLSSQVNANPDHVIPLNLPIPAGYRLYVTIGTAPGGSAEWAAAGIGGHY